MPTLLPALFNSLQQYGYPVLWGSIVVAALGVPLPTSLILLAMGALAARGDFNLLLLFVLALNAFVCGDTIGYGIGRRWGKSTAELAGSTETPVCALPVHCGTISRLLQALGRMGRVSQSLPLPSIGQQHQRACRKRTSVLKKSCC